ncbi:hypothetical protein [Jiangella asiatica]|uniref:Uncharacterized protein n=1 Tax=Jiangella asiatica TaxID=2530372 RepID=A0A4R5DAN4_9ACTN|nr:hypothetical protein [Jiangella asiatica]TDE10659.1 hypothetical protein E1269_11335 [Jiangella asiatica]
MIMDELAADGRVQRQVDEVAARRERLRATRREFDRRRRYGKERLHALKLARLVDHPDDCPRPRPVERIERAATGQARLVLTCPACGGTDHEEAP